MTSLTHRRAADVNLRHALQLREYEAIADRIARDRARPRARLGLRLRPDDRLLRARGLDVDAFDYRPGRAESGPRPLAKYPEITAYIETQRSGRAALRGRPLRRGAQLRRARARRRPGRLAARDQAGPPARRHASTSTSCPTAAPTSRRSPSGSGLYYHGAWPDDRVYDLAGRPGAARAGRLPRCARRGSPTCCRSRSAARLVERLAPQLWALNRGLGDRAGRAALATNVELVARPELALAPRVRSRAAGRRRRRSGRRAARAGARARTARAAMRSRRPPGNRQRPATAYCSVAGSPTVLVDVSSALGAQAGALEQRARARAAVKCVRWRGRSRWYQRSRNRRACQRAEVRDRDDDTARPARAPRRRARRSRARLGRVLERVLEDDEVVRRRAPARRCRACPRGRRRRARAAAAHAAARRLDAGHRPARADQQRGEVAAAAADVEPAARARAAGDRREREAPQREAALDGADRRARPPPSRAPSASAYGP